jgi:thiamine pyrophosphate-dependent acetolactate synthase large subunit-like protein
MERIEAIKTIMDTVTDELVISSAGMISRDVYSVKDRPENFYVMGSMGATLGIGIGLALNTKKKVIVIAGDGEILMNLDTLVLMNKLQLPNLRLYIIDNKSYASTGGQKTCSDAADFKQIAPCIVYEVEPGKGDSPRIGISHREITRRFKDAIKKR